jgi:hypothetical protein
MVNVHAFLGVQKVGLKALGVTIRCETTAAPNLFGLNAGKEAARSNISYLNS